MAIPRGYVQFRRDAVGHDLRERIKQVLTITPTATSSFDKKMNVIRMWAEEGEVFAVPRGFFNTYIKTKYVDEYKFTVSMGSNSIILQNPISLRPGQGPLIDKGMEHLRGPFAGVIYEAQTGTGKTVLGLETARRLGLKTLVVVPRDIIADQWIEEVRKFLPHWRIGRLQANIIDVKDKDIVISTLQSVSLKDYEAPIYEDFGTIIIDEVHQTGAPEFSKVLHRFIPKYIIGLSGTLQRQDKAENVFIHGIGSVLSGGTDMEVMSPHIYFIDTGFSWNSMMGNDMDLDKQKPYFLRDIIACETRNEMIVRQVTKAAESGRNVLVLSERIVHVETLAQMLRQRGVDVGLMIGTTKKVDRKLAEKARVICATSQLIGTAFNEPRLDTLVMASPLQAVVQPVGRIRRTFPNKKTPLVLDMVDAGYMPKIYALSRRKKYLAKGWTVFNDQFFRKREE